MEPFFHTLSRMEEYFHGGGIVMVPLAAVSLVMWVLIVNRVLYFRRLYRKNMDTKTAWAHIHDNRLPDPAHYRGAVSMLAGCPTRRIIAARYPCWWPRSWKTGADRPPWTGSSWTRPC